MRGHYSLFQYMPRPDRREAVNVGVVLVADGHARAAFLADVGRLCDNLVGAHEAELSDLLTSVSSWVESDIKRHMVRNAYDLTVMRRRFNTSVIMRKPKLISLESVDHEITALFDRLVWR